jgi:RimJ/RimL family protein N-acetyltransferase
MTTLRTRRLELGELSFDDAEFIIELLNDKSFLRFIGDKGVRTTADANEYLRNGPMDSYRRHGFGLYLVRLVSDRTRIGICGLVRRSGLDHPDVGFALLPVFRGHGYGYEAAAAVVNYARTGLGLKRILGITDPDNHVSIRLLEKAGFGFERRMRLSADAAEISLYSIEI